MVTVDIIILMIVLIYALVGWLRGFIRTVFHLVGGIVAFVGAWLLTAHFSDTVGQWLTPAVSRSVEKALPSLTGSTDLSSVSGEELWQSLSGYMQSLLTATGTTATEVAESDSPQMLITESLSGQTAHAIAYVLLFLLAFVVISLLLRFVAGALDLVAHLPVLHAFNHLFGALLGAVIGLLLCTCVLWVLKLFAPAMYSDVGLLPPETMEKSVIASTLVGWNGGVSLFEGATTD